MRSSPNPPSVPHVVSVDRLTWDDPHLADIALPGGTMRLTRSLTSGLTRQAGDPPDWFWGVGDRGPNIKPSVAVDRYGVTTLASLAGLDGAKVMPLPSEGPRLARFRLVDDSVMLEFSAPLTDTNARPLPGLPVPYGLHAEREPVFDLDASPLACDPAGADTEGIAALPDGGFWIAEEYGPSLLRIDRSGRALVRWVPVGTAASYADAAIPLVETLPAVAVARKLNRGFEGIAASADGATLYVAFQSPLAHPDRAAHATSRLVRIWTLSATDGRLLAEHAYQLDPPHMFERDIAAGAVEPTDIKISELVLVGPDTLLVLERVSHSTRIYRVTLDSARRLPKQFTDAATRPSLEQLDDDVLAAAGIVPVAKHLLLSTDDFPMVSADLEGMVLLDPHTLLLVNDSDFGIEGASTAFWRVRFDTPIG